MLTSLCMYVEHICNFSFHIFCFCFRWVLGDFKHPVVRHCSNMGECIFISELILLDPIYNTFENGTVASIRRYRRTNIWLFIYQYWPLTILMTTRVTLRQLLRIFQYLLSCVDQCRAIFYFTRTIWNSSKTAQTANRCVVVTVLLFQGKFILWSQIRSQNIWREDRKKNVWTC